MANRVAFERRQERPVYPRLRTLDRPRPLSLPEGPLHLGQPMPLGEVRQARVLTGNGLQLGLALGVFSRQPLDGYSCPLRTGLLKRRSSQYPLRPTWGSISAFRRPSRITSANAETNSPNVAVGLSGRPVLLIKAPCTTLLRIRYALLIRSNISRGAYRGHSTNSAARIASRKRSSPRAPGSPESLRKCDSAAIIRSTIRSSSCCRSNAVLNLRKAIAKKPRFSSLPSVRIAHSFWISSNS